MKLKNHLWTLLYSFFLVAFTIYVLLDTFVITRVYIPVPSNKNTSLSGNTNAGTTTSMPEDKDTDADATTSASEENSSNITISTENTYSDNNISITLTEYREYDTSIYVADVQLTSAEYLKTAFAKNAYGKNVTEKTSSIAENNGAILAINGDYYGVQENQYVLRNGVLYRNTPSKNQEDLVIYNDGSFEIITETDYSAEQLLSNGAMQILSFGPALVMNRAISVTEDEEVGKAKASNPRTAIGIIDNLHYLFVVSDGRTKESEGLSLYELAEIMTSLGATTAYNLDGGGSSTMYFNGKVINQPTTNGRSIKERSVSDIVYIGY